MELQTRFDDAVSPVVGVILMVAVTVILAAVIGTFVLDLGNNVQANPQAGVNFDQTPNGSNGVNVDAQVISMENADYLDVTHDSASAAASVTAASGASQGDADGVGQTVSVDNLQNGDEVTVIGVLDGKEAVLQTYTVDA